MSKATVYMSMSDVGVMIGNEDLGLMVGAGEFCRVWNNGGSFRDALRAADSVSRDKEMANSESDD